MAFSHQAQDRSELWITDNGSSHRYTDDGLGYDLVQIRLGKDKVTIGNMKEMRVLDVGGLNLRLHQGTRDFDVTLQNVL